MKSKPCFPLLLAAGLCAAVGLTQPLMATTFLWDGGGLDANWNTGDNWDGNPASGPAATGDDLVFDGVLQTTNANNLPVTGLTGIVYNSTADPFTSTGTQAVTLTGNITNNSAQVQTLNMPIAISGARTVSVAENGSMVFGAAGSAYAFTVNNGISVFTGAGEVQVLGTSNLQISTGTATTADMSGLAKFTANVTTFRVGNLTAAVNATTRLAATNSITATTLHTGTCSGNFVCNDSLLLGTATTINANTILIGQKRSKGALNFDTGLSNPAVTIVGSSGGASKAAMTLGDYNTSNTAQTPTGTANFTGGTVTAQFSSLILGQQNPNGNSNAVSTGTGNFTVDGATSSVAADTVRLGYWGNSRSPTAVQTATGNLTITDGTVTVANALRLADQGAFGAGSGNANTRSNGTVNVNGGTLDVSGAFVLGDRAGSLGGATSDAKAVVTIGGGLVNANVAITTNNARSTLTLSGGTLDMNGNAIGTDIQPIGGNGGALTFASGILKNVAEINGGLTPLTKTTAGSLTLSGTNTHTGGTTVAAGTVVVDSATAINTTGPIAVNGILDVSALGGWTMGASQALMGNGTLVGTTTCSGAVSPGTSIGTLSVTGGLTLDTGSSLNIEIDPVGIIQVETATAAGTAAADGDVDVTVVDTSGTLVTLSVPVLTGDTADVWAGKVRTALSGNAAVTALYAVGGSDAAMVLTRLTAAANDPALNIALANGTTSPGITPAATSADTTAGVAPADDILAVSGALDISAATLNLTVSGTLTAPAYVIATYGSLVPPTGPFLNEGTLPPGYIVDYAYSGNQIAIKQNTGGDTTPPLWTSGWPKADTLTTTGFTARARTNETGTAYFVVLANDATPPSAADVKAGTGAIQSGAIPLTINTEATSPVTGLSAGTAYDVWFVAEDAIPNVQASPVKVDVTTDAPPLWTSGWPKADTLTATGFTARAQINEAGTAYFVVLANDAPDPSSDDVKAGTGAIQSGSIPLTANTEATSPVTGLSAATAYDVWFVAEDAIPNLQASPVKVDVTTTAAASGYAVWASTRGNQTPGEDFDNDGVSNGLEYFMGAADGFTANPGVDPLTNKVTWPMDPAYDGSYVVETSPDLSTWTPVAATQNPTSVEYTLPNDEDKIFVRLVVTPN